MRGVKVKEDGTSDSFLSKSFEKSKLDDFIIEREKIIANIEMLK